MKALQACLVKETVIGDCADANVMGSVSVTCIAGGSAANTVEGCRYANNNPTTPNICYDSTRTVGAALRHHCFQLNAATQQVTETNDEGEAGMLAAAGFCQADGTCKQ